jgi:hypothetical protein
MSSAGHVPSRLDSTGDVVVTCGALLLPSAAILLAAREMWPFAAAALLGVVLVLWMRRVRADRARLSSYRDTAAGLTAAATFFAAYSAEIDRIPQGGVTVLLAIPLAFATLLSSTRLRGLDAREAEAQDRQRLAEERARHTETMTLLHELLREVRRR